MSEMLEWIDGEVRIRGCRISLNLFMEEYVTIGMSIEQLHDRFPTMTPEKIEKVCLVCDETILW